MSKLPKVVIIGQPNTGKSTLFNNIIGNRKAIEHHQPGVTRDFIEEQVTWQDTSFLLIDTGGLYAGDSFEEIITTQVENIISSASIVIFLANAQQGPNPIDKNISSLLRKTSKTTFLVVNKVDHTNHEAYIYDFHSLGFDFIIPISAVHNRGVGTLLDKIVLELDKSFVGNLSKVDKEEKKESIIKVAIAGRPNVGKSTLINALLKEERSIVSDYYGTTRDSIAVKYSFKEKNYLFIDTAGLRQKARVKEDVEYYSNVRSIDAINSADVTLLVLDSVSTITEQDQKIAGQIKKAGCACIILLNKWDLIPKNDHTIYVFEEEIRRRLHFLKDMPIIFISAKTKQRINNIYDKIEYVFENAQQKITTSALNKCLQDLQAEKPSPNFKGKRLKIFYAVQTKNKPFTISIYVNNPQLIHFSYKRYIINKLRKAFLLEGVFLNVKLIAK